MATFGLRAFPFSRSLVLLLLFCPFGVAAQPAALPAGDFPVTVSMRGWPANHRYDVRLATNGENFLAAWIDERAGFEARRLIVTRVDRGGNPLDGDGGVGIALGEPWNVAEFSVASDGVDYLVVWRPIEGDLQLARIDGTTGTVTPLPAIGDGWMFDLSLLWTGSRYVLVHREIGLDDAVRVLELDRAGRPVGQVRSVATANAPITALRAIAFGSNDFLAVWTAGGKTYAKQAGSNGAAVQISESSAVSALASSGSTVMAALSTPVEQQRTQVSTIVLGENGSIVRAEEAAGEAVTTPQRTDVAWNGSRFQLLVVANDARSVRIVAYQADGGLLEYPRTLVTGEIYDVVAASAQGETLALYTWRPADSGVTLQVRAKNVAGNGTEKAVSISEPETGLPVLVWRGDHYLSVWLDRYGNRSDALFQAVYPDGTTRQSRGTILASSVYGEDDRLSMDTDGEKALVVWYSRGASTDVVQALLVDNAEEDTSSQTLITLSAASRVQSDIAVRWNGSEYLVAWASQVPHALYGMRVAADGTLLDAQPVVLAAERASHRPAIAWNGTHWVVAYVAAVPRNPNAEYLQFDLYVHAVQVTRNLTATGAPMRLSVAEPTPPRIAARNGEVLVVWGTTAEADEIYGARIVSGANLDGPAGFRIGAGSVADVYPTESGYLLLEPGGYGRTVAGRSVSARQKLFPFVPELAQVDLVPGGPKPLLVYRAWPTGSEQVPQVRARYVSEGGGRRRAVGR